LKERAEDDGVFYDGEIEETSDIADEIFDAIEEPEYTEQKVKEIKKMGKVARWEVYKSKAKKVSWCIRLKAANNKIQVSGSGYDDKRSAIRGIKAVVENCKRAKIVFLDDE